MYRNLQYTKTVLRISFCARSGSWEHYNKRLSVLQFGRILQLDPRAHVLHFPQIVTVDSPIEGDYDRRFSLCWHRVRDSGGKKASQKGRTVACKKCTVGTIWASSDLANVWTWALDACESSASSKFILGTQWRCIIYRHDFSRELCNGVL